MTLTEQRKTGKLKDGFYYVKLVDEEYGRIITDKYCSSFRGWEGSENWEISEVLAPVPSYEEWQELQEYKRIVTSYNMKPIDYDIACETVNKLLDEKEKLRNELGLLKESIGKDCGTYYTNLFLQENQQFKELLKECREFFYENLIDAEFHFSCGLGSDIKKQSCIRSLSKLKTKIDNAIGEKRNE